MSGFCGHHLTDGANELRYVEPHRPLHTRLDELFGVGRNTGQLTRIPPRSLVLGTFDPFRKVVACVSHGVKRNKNLSMSAHSCKKEAPVLRISKAPSLIPIIAIALGIALAGCSGGSSSPSAGSSSTSSSSSSTSSTSSQALAADKALGEAANLKLSDFPAGWTSSPSTSNSANNSIDQQVAICLHTPIQILENNANNPRRADSPDFSDTNGSQASSSVTYDADSAQVAHQFSLLQRPELPMCLEKAIATVIGDEILHPNNTSGTLPQGAKVGSPTVRQMSFPSLGDRSIAYRVTVPITLNTLTIDGYIDFIAIQKGRVAVGLSLVGTGTPFDTTQAEHLANVVLGRVSDT